MITMKKMKFGLMFLTTLLFTNLLFAQTIEEGKRFMYYERFKSAKSVFEKMLAANPNNDEAAYWLGQAMINEGDRSVKTIAEVKSLYQSKLSANPNSALLMAGIGHLELIEGKKQDARNHFEAAVSLSQGKNPAVLNAIGLANGNPESKNGDPAYAVEKLKQAKDLAKKGADPDVLVNLGDAYRKLGDGGNAILSYQAALAVNPKYARANYRIGKIYESQGFGQESIFMKYYNDVIAQDATYAPVYGNLFNYYYNTNVTKAAEYMDKWLVNSDDDPKACYYRASIKYAQGLFNEAISKSNECIAGGGANPYPSLYGLKAYSYDKLKDSANAKLAFEEYFKRQATEKIGAGDKTTYAKILLKFPGNEEQAGNLIEQAIAEDSIEENKVSYLKAIAQAYESQGKFKEAGEWFNKVTRIRKNVSKTDLFYAGYNFFRSGAYDSSLSVYNRYVEKYPDDIFGYYWVGKTNSVIDSTGALGLAVPPYQKAIEIGEAAPDKEKVKVQLIGAYKYFIEYYYNVKKEQDSALVYLDKALVLDPADASLISNREFISKNDPKAPPKKAQPKATPKSKGAKTKK